MLLQILLYFGLGIISEFLATLFYQYIFQRKQYPAILMNTGIMLLSFFIISHIVVSPNYFLIVIYIAGQNLGILLAMKLNIKK